MNRGATIKLKDILTKMYKRYLFILILSKLLSHHLEQPYYHASTPVLV